MSTRPDNTGLIRAPARPYGGIGHATRDWESFDRRNLIAARSRSLQHAGASLLAIECQPSRIKMKLKTNYLDVLAKNLEEGLAMIERACRERKPLSVGVLGNAAEMLPELAHRGVTPDALTDQTSAHDPAGWTLAEWEARRMSNPKRRRAQRSRG